MAAENILEPEDEPISLDGDDEHISLDDEPISLVDSAGASEFAEGGGMQAFGMGAQAPGAEERQYKRPLNTNGTGATRCRVFHSKIAVASLEFMEHQINDWLDSDEIEVKDVGHIIGIMEGKRPEPNLMVVVWY